MRSAPTCAPSTPRRAVLVPGGWGRGLLPPPDVPPRRRLQQGRRDPLEARSPAHRPRISPATSAPRDDDGHPLSTLWPKSTSTSPAPQHQACSKRVVDQEYGNLSGWSGPDIGTKAGDPPLADGYPSTSTARGRRSPAHFSTVTPPTCWCRTVLIILCA
jgi:hypothetical protein